MLHLVNYSFSGPDDAKRCLARMGEADRLLLIGNGVFSAIKASDACGQIESSLHRIRVFALSPDLSARGIPDDALVSGVQVVDYSGFVRLAAEHGPVHSWFK
ncbi:MAG: sulfurtransferase complex subunit TusB [Methylococcales bacterium]